MHDRYRFRRGHWAVGHLRTGSTPAVVGAAAVAVMVVTAASIASVQKTSDDAWRRAWLVASVKADVRELHGIQKTSLADERFTVQMTLEHKRTHGHLDPAVRGVAGNARLGTVVARYRAYLAIFHATVGAVADGRMRAARLADWDADRAYTRLERALDQATTDARAEAAAAAEKARRETLALMAAALAAMAVLLFAMGRRRRGAEHEAALRESEARLRAVVDHSSDMITVVRSDGVVESQSAASERMLGLRPDEIAGRAFATLVHPDDHGRLAQLRASARAGTVADWRLRRRDGSWLHAETAVSALGGDAVSAGALVLITRDAEERKTAEQQLRHRASHDPLTDLANRDLLHERMEAALARAVAPGSVAFLYLDLDDFKRVNDSLGHAAGDELLAHIGRRIRSCLAADQVAGRVGGDEFGILLDLAGGGDPAAHAARILGALGHPFMIGGRTVGVRPSIGIAVNRPGDEPQELARRADVAMYAAKRNGKARYAMYDPALEGAGGERAAGVPDAFAALGERRRTRTEIEEVLARPELVVPVFQPIVDLRTGLLAGYEALSRFPHVPDRPPHVWFQQAHACGLGTDLEEAAMRSAIARPGRPDGAYLSLNVSPSVLADGGVAALPDDLTGIMVEVTEHELVAEGTMLEDALAALRARGATVAVDDAGSGYAGFTQLMRVRPDLIKLDRAVVAGVDQDAAKSALIESFVAFASRVGARVCAEGVETLEELRALADLDVHSAQGYVLGRPAAEWGGVDPDAARVCSTALADVIAEDGPTLQRTGNAEWRLEQLSALISAVASPADLVEVLALVARELHADEMVFSHYNRAAGTLETVSTHALVPTGELLRAGGVSGHRGRPATSARAPGARERPGRRPRRGRAPRRAGRPLGAARAGRGGRREHRAHRGVQPPGAHVEPARDPPRAHRGEPHRRGRRARAARLGSAGTPPAGRIDAGHARSTIVPMTAPEICAARDCQHLATSRLEIQTAPGGVVRDVWLCEEHRDVATRDPVAFAAQLEMRRTGQHR
jgi:diguanylate cyclase (GGDEF)-like protein/PAS domain S-box-containing protein